MRGSSQRCINSRLEFAEGQPALREVLTQGRGRRVPVSIASAQAGCWCLMILGPVLMVAGFALYRPPSRSRSAWV